MNFNVKMQRYKAFRRKRRRKFSRPRPRQRALSYDQKKKKKDPQMKKIDKLDLFKT